MVAKPPVRPKMHPLLVFSLKWIVLPLGFLTVLALISGAGHRGPGGGGFDT
jgi:hypothetical protein